MKINILSKYLQRLEEISSRNEITKILADLFKESDKKEIDKVVYLSLGFLAPSYKNIIFNMADQMIVRALAKAFDTEVEKVKILYKKKGDLGTVAFELAKGQGKNLEVSEVYNKLAELAKEGGLGSQERRIDKMADLLKALDPLSSRFVTRIPLGKLRLGFSDLTIIDALSWYEKGDKSAKSDLVSAYQVQPDIGLLAKRVKEVGIKKATGNPKPLLGIPVAPMLAQRLNSPTEMVKKMGKVAIEPKFDGVRVQIHYKKKGEVHAFTRNLHDVFLMFPELKTLGKYIKAQEAILDTEAIGVDEKTKMLLDFQVTMTRRRKHEVENFAEKVPITFNVFDCLLVDGEDYMLKNYEVRHEKLKKIIKEDHLIKMVDNIVTDDPAVIDKEYKDELSKGLEGIMVKKIDSYYVPGRTGWRWVKMKQTSKTAGKLSDTVDCVIMGFTGGKGKRVSFGLGQFLVGVKDGEEIKTVTKVGTGLTDEQFKALKEKLGKLVVSQKPKEYVVNKVLEPDFWVEPEVVVEIAADDITKSPNHTAGYALRFPRLVQFREDKAPKDATTVGEIKKLFDLQKNK